MECKLLTVIDTATEMQVVALRADELGRAPHPLERSVLAKAGFGRIPSEQRDYVILGMLTNLGETTYDPHRWKNRTMFAAHQVLLAHWEEFTSGDVFDVRPYFNEVLTGTVFAEALPLGASEQSR